MNISSLLIRTVIAPLWAKREKSSYQKYCADIKKKEHMSSDERTYLQFNKLKSMISHAYNCSEYYRMKFSTVGFQPSDFKSFDDLCKLPILTKTDIQNHKELILQKNADAAKLWPRKTSGSTGVSLNFFVTEEEMQYKRGITLYRDQWSGWRLGEWKAMVWGNPEYLYSWRGRFRNNFLDRCFSLDTLKMDSMAIDNFIRDIFKKKPTLLFGHAHSLYLLAKFWEDNNIPSYKFKGMISTAMVLHDFERELCESVFNCKVFNRYGCEEVSLIASECEAHTGLHINTDSLYVEIVENDKTTTQNAPGAIIITDLCNKTMPFIRYQVGDMGKLSDKKCPCGRTYPLLDNITGRIADYLRAVDGSWVSGISLTENFATLISGIGQIQIIQDQQDHLLLRIVKNTEFNNKSLEKIQMMVGELFGNMMRYTCDYVEKIEPEKSGKYRFTIYKA